MPKSRKALFPGPQTARKFYNQMIAKGWDIEKRFPIGRLTGFVDISVTLLDRITPVVGSIEGNWMGTGGYYLNEDQMQLRTTLQRWSHGLGKTPAIGPHIYDAYFDLRENGGWPEKRPSWYAAKYPTQLVQHGNLELAITKLKTNPQSIIVGGFAQANQGTWEVNLSLAAYFGTYQQTRGPRKETGINYVWMQEFGFPPHAERSFIRPALEKSAAEWGMNWEVEVQAAKHLMEHTISAGVPSIITSTKPGMSTLSSIVHKLPDRHANWFALLLWLLPVNKYIAILAALKDVRGAIKGGRLSAGSIKTWLQSQVMGSTGLTIKSKRKSFRKQLYA